MVTFSQAVSFTFHSSGTDAHTSGYNTANALRAMLHSTASPTLLQAGTALNVIPGEATAQLDCRIVPGETVKTLTAALRHRIRDPKVAV